MKDKLYSCYIGKITIDIYKVTRHDKHYTVRYKKTIVSSF